MRPGFDLDSLDGDVEDLLELCRVGSLHGYLELLSDEGEVVVGWCLGQARELGFQNRVFVFERCDLGLKLVEAFATDGG